MPRRQTIDQLRQVMQSLPDGLSHGWLTGEPVLVVDGFRYVEQDGRRLGRWSAVLLGLTIIICFRSLRWVLIPIAVVQLALLTTRALLAALQLRLSMVSSMLTAVVLVVGVATMVHVIVRFRESRRAGPIDRGESAADREAAGRADLLGLPDRCGGLPGADRVSSVGPVQDFGLMMSIGALMVLVSVALLVPGLGLMGIVGSSIRDPLGRGPVAGSTARAAATGASAPLSGAGGDRLIVAGSPLGNRASAGGDGFHAELSRRQRDRSGLQLRGGPSRRGGRLRHRDSGAGDAGLGVLAQTRRTWPRS